jgi:hypothetical protein
MLQNVAVSKGKKKLLRYLGVNCEEGKPCAPGIDAAKSASGGRPGFRTGDPASSQKLNWQSSWKPTPP